MLVFNKKLNLILLSGSGVQDEHEIHAVYVTRNAVKGVKYLICRYFFRWLSERR